MTTINLGKIKPLYKGTYTGGATYRPLDFTLYLGNLYVCKASSTGNLPTNPAYFDPVTSVNAASIPNTPAGSISATTVQAAINDLDSEKVAKTDVIAIAKGGTGATSANAAADAIGAFRKGTILGTVSQSAGVPTGAVIERGSNANGEYTKFADGLMWCWAHRYAVLANPSHILADWVYPAAFVGHPVTVSGVLNAPYFTLLKPSTFVTHHRVNTEARASCLCPGYNLTNADRDAIGYFTMSATGRWF